MPLHPLAMIQCRRGGWYPRVETCVLSEVGQSGAQYTTKQESDHDRGERPGADQQSQAAYRHIMHVYHHRYRYHH